jgi:hypothetical protein
MAPSDSRSVNRCGHGHLACKFPINVTVPPNGLVEAKKGRSPDGGTGPLRVPMGGTMMGEGKPHHMPIHSTACRGRNN